MFGRGNAARLQIVTTPAVAPPRQQEIGRGYTDVKGAAKYLGRTEKAIRMMFSKGLIGRKVVGRVQFSYDDLDRLYTQQPRVHGNSSLSY